MKSILLTAISASVLPLYILADSAVIASSVNGLFKRPGGGIMAISGFSGIASMPV
jgi:hypothetical protein